MSSAGDRDHPAIPTLEAVAFGGDRNHPAVSSLEAVPAGRNGDHVPVSPLQSVAAVWNGNFLAIAAAELVGHRNSLIAERCDLGNSSAAYKSMAECRVLATEGMTASGADQTSQLRTC